jgi:hypothetical protein
MGRRGHGRQGVLHVVRAGLAPAHLCHGAPRRVHPEGRAVRLQPVPPSNRRPRRWTASASSSPSPAPRPRPARHGMHDQPAAGHGAHQMVELALDHGQIIEDVGVIELQVVDDQGPRAVVDELAALVEKGRVVLVRLDDEIGAARRAARTGRSPAARRRSGSPAPAPHPPTSRRACSRCWSCRGCRPPPARADRAADAPPATAAPRRRAAGVEHVLHRGNAALHRVADHHHVRRRLQVRRLVALHQLDAGGLQLRAHGRIDVGIRARHPVPRPRANSATPPMKVPQMPRMCRCMSGSPLGQTADDDEAEDIEGDGDDDALRQAQIQGMAQDVPDHQHAPGHQRQEHQPREQQFRTGLGSGNPAAGAASPTGTSATKPITASAPSSAVAVCTIARLLVQVPSAPRAARRAIATGPADSGRALADHARAGGDRQQHPTEQRPPPAPRRTAPATRAGPGACAAADRGRRRIGTARAKGGTREFKNSLGIIPPASARRQKPTCARSDHRLSRLPA